MKVKMDKVKYPKSVKYKRNPTEVPLSTLWEHSEHVFSIEDNIPPKEWDYKTDYKTHKVKL